MNQALLLAMLWVARSEAALEYNCAAAGLILKAHQSLQTFLNTSEVISEGNHGQ
jgi:hypothetical protein